MICTQQTLPVACLPQCAELHFPKTAQSIDHPLIQQIRRGETASVFTWAFHEVFPAVRARFGRKGICRTQASELFTDAVLDFIAVFQKNTTLDGQNPAGYLWRICRNKQVDWYRKQARKPDAIRYELLSGHPSDPDAALLAEVLHRHLERLPKSYREIVRLYYFEEMSCMEIARQLGSTADSVKERKCRAIRRLRAAFL